MSKEYLCIVSKYAIFDGRVKMLFLKDFHPTERPYVGQCLDGSTKITDLGNGWIGKGDYESHAVWDKTPWNANVPWAFGDSLDSATSVFLKYISEMQLNGWCFVAASAVDGQWPKWDRESMSLARLLDGMSERRQRTKRILRGM
jgi:hypothetical protein